MSTRHVLYCLAAFAAGYWLGARAVGNLVQAGLDTGHLTIS